MVLKNEVAAFFESEIAQLRDDIPEIKGWKDYNIFDFMCQKYYFFMDPSASYSNDDIISAITDGPNDGSIDSISINTAWQ